MRITIYKSPKNYMIYDFKPIELDKIREICYSMGIKFYTISYTDKEKNEYEQLSKRHN